MTLTAAHSSAGAQAGDKQGSARFRPTLGPRLAGLVVVVVFVGFVIMSLGWLFQSGATLEDIAVAVVATGVLVAMQLAFFSHPKANLRSTTAYWLLAAQLLVSYLPLLYFDDRAWVGMEAFAAGNVLLVLPPLFRWVAWAGVAASGGVLGAVHGEPPLGVIYLVVAAALTGLVVYGLSRLRSLVTALHESRADLARAALAEERLRFARDVHDLLASGLSAITLKSELAQRLVEVNPERASSELAQVLDISRQALADARSVAGGSKHVSLAEEVELARSLTAAADITMTADVAELDLPEPIDAALATVVREGVTNILQHSEANRCTVTVHRLDDTVAIEIRNDRPHSGRTMPAADHGNGIANLSTRVNALGGTLTARHQPDETFALQARVPLRSPTPVSAGSRTPVAETAPGRRAQQQLREATLRFPAALVAAVLVCFFTTGTLWVASTVQGAGPAAFALVCIGAVAALLLLYFTNPRTDLGSPRSLAVLAATAALVFSPPLLLENPYLGTPGLLAGAVLLSLRPTWAVGGFVLVVGSIPALHAYLGSDTQTIVYGGVSTALTGLAVFGLARLRAMVDDAVAARTELAELAVTEQRLRFGHDLQDAVGQRLSSIIMKSELALRLTAEQPDQAREELGELLRTARNALADVRQVAAGYRDTNLDKEATSVRSVLTAAGIDLDTYLDHGELPQTVHSLLAAVLRESITNLLRHSTATHCTINVGHTHNVVTLDITNDGVTAAPDDNANRGGLDALRTRVAEHGGTLTAEHRPNHEFAVRVRVPVRDDEAAALQLG